MKLNITFVLDVDTGKERALITDDRGLPMPGVRAVTVDYRFDEPTIVTIELVVNRTDVTVGCRR